MTPTSSTDRYLISSVLTHFADVARQIVQSSECKKTLDGPGVDPELEGYIHDAINALEHVANKYAQVADYQAAILEDHANDNAEIAQLLEQNT